MRPEDLRVALHIILETIANRQREGQDLLWFWTPDYQRQVFLDLETATLTQPTAHPQVDDAKIDKPLMF